MKDEGLIIALVIGAIAIFFFAVNRGLISSGVSVGVGAGGATSVKGIIAPQPSQNYSGYLAASTAPGVAGAINGLLSGIGSGASAWFSGVKSTPTPAVGNPAQAAAPVSSVANAAQQQSVYDNTPLPLPALGPQLSDVNLAYDNTSGSSFGYDALAADNAYSPGDSLSIVDDTSIA